MLTEDILFGIDPVGAAALAGFDPLLIGSGAGDEDAWLAACVELLAGRRTWSGAVQSALARGDDVEALRVAVRAGQHDCDLDSDAWGAIKRTFEAISSTGREDRKAALAGLNAIPPFLTDLHAEAIRLVQRTDCAPLPESFPRDSQSLNKLLAALDELREVRGEAEALRQLADEEQERRRSELWRHARRAFERVIGDLEGTATPLSSPAAVALRALPDMLLNQQVLEVERIADAARELDPTFLASLSMGRESAWSAIHHGLRRPDLLPRLPRARVSTERRAHLPLSSVSDTLVKNVRRAPTGVSDADAHWDLSSRAARLASPKEVSEAWLSAANATTDPRWKRTCLAEGLLAAARARMEHGDYRFAVELMRDALINACAVEADLGDRCVEASVPALVAARVWPRYQHIAERDRRAVRIDDWVDTPGEMFRWLMESGSLDVVATLWADLPEWVGRRFLEVIVAHVGDPLLVYRVCASAVLTASRLQGDPDEVVGRIRWLLSPAEPPAALSAALDEIAHEIVAAGRSRSAARPRVMRLVPVIQRSLSDLRRDTAAPVDEVLDILPPLLTRLVEGEKSPKEARPTPKLLAGAFYPAERTIDLRLPVRVSNAVDAAGATNLFLSLAWVGDSSDPLRPRFAGGLSRAERHVGDLESGESRTIEFLLDLPEGVEREVTNWDFEAEVRSGAGVQRGKTFPLSVAIQPKDRRERVSPYRPGGALTKDHRFVGRREEIKHVLDALVGPYPDRIPLVQGIRRIGKTSLLNKVAADPEVIRQLLPIYISLENLSADATTTTLFNRIMDRVQQAAQQGRIGLAPRKVEEGPGAYAQFERFVDDSTAALAGRKLLLIFDEFDALLGRIAEAEERQAQLPVPLGPHQVIQKELLGTLRLLVMKGAPVKMVFAGMPTILEHVRYEDRLFGMMFPVRVPPFSTEEAVEILEAGSDVLEFTREARENVLTITGCQPYLLQVVCHELYAHMQGSGRDLVTTLDVDDVARGILHHENCFTDYLRLVGDDSPLLRALAMALREAAPRREFASVGEVAAQFQRLGVDASPDLIQARLEELRAGDRPLVVRAPNATNRFRLVIGMLGDFLITQAEG